MYDLETKQWFVAAKDGRISLRDFYIAAREKSGKTIYALEKEIGASQQSLRYVERPNSKGYQYNQSNLILRALEALGYTISLKEPKNEP